MRRFKVVSNEMKNVTCKYSNITFSKKNRAEYDKDKNNWQLNFNKRGCRHCKIIIEDEHNKEVELNSWNERNLIIN